MPVKITLSKTFILCDIWEDDYTSVIEEARGIEGLLRKAKWVDRK